MPAGATTKTDRARRTKQLEKAIDRTKLSRRAPAGGGLILNEAT